MKQLKSDSASVRCKVAREAATLLYFGSEKEYKQAKVKAAENLGVHVLPTNLEVALELDHIAEENEGSSRPERLVHMRREALEIMTILKAYCPVLIGSVWRGTIRRGSDIDIAVYHDEPDEVVTLLRDAGLKILRTERVTVNKRGKTEGSFHIHAESSDNQSVEIVVRPAEEAGRKRTCEVFGDELKGLKLRELEKVLRDNSNERFLPS
jgi:predicted nucleotidyltransferase